MANIHLITHWVPESTFSLPIGIPILYIGKLRHKEAKNFSRILHPQGLTGSKRS